MLFAGPPIEVGISMHVVSISSISEVDMVRSCSHLDLHLRVSTKHLLAGLHRRHVLPPGVAGRASELREQQRRAGGAGHQSGHARQDLVARHVFRQRKTSQVSRGDDEERVSPHQTVRTYDAESQVRFEI